MPLEFSAFEKYNDLKSEFFRILEQKQVYTVFQPIFGLKDGEIIGYEALGRGPADSPLHSPVDLLKIAEEEQKLFELDLLFRKKALEKAGSSGFNKLLFINVDPSIIKDPNFKKGFTRDMLLEFGISPKSIVFEITERTAIKDYQKFCEVLNNYIEQGYQIAIDDVGSGYSGLRTISEIRPHFIKIDMDLIRDIDNDQFKQSMVKALISISENSSIRLIAEGIETAEELKTLIRLGVQFGQGFFLQRPQAQLPVVSEKSKEIIKDFNQVMNNMKSFSHDYHYIFDLIKNDQCFSVNEECAVIKNILIKPHVQVFALWKTIIP